MLDESRSKREIERSDERPPQVKPKRQILSASAKFSDLLIKFYESSFRPSSINTSKPSHTSTDIKQVLIKGHPDIRFSPPKYQDFLVIALKYQPSDHLTSTY